MKRISKMPQRRRSKKYELKQFTLILLWLLLLPIVLAVYQTLYKHGILPEPPAPVKEFIDYVVPFLLPLALGILASMVIGVVPMLGVVLVIAAALSLGYLVYQMFIAKPSVGSNTTGPQY